MRPIVMLIALAACGGTPAPSSAPAPEPTPEPEAPSAAEAIAPDGDEIALREARVGLKELGGALKGRLTEALKEGDVLKAAAVCSDQAQLITQNAARKSGVRVGRTSLRLRNPRNAGPTWVTAWLEQQGDVPGAAAEGYARVLDTPDGRVARVVKPLVVEAPCLSCHGPREQVPDPVKRLLADRYPEDQATGYALGDLRGAIWSEAAVDGEG